MSTHNEDSSDVASSDLEGIRLISLPISPWSERARFAMKVAGILDKVEVVDYTPMQDVLWLRWILGNWKPSAVVTVPVLVFKDGSVISDSTGIAKWAASVSPGKLVVPPEDILNRVIKLTDQCLACGRFRGCSKGAEAGDYDINLLPPPLRFAPDWLIRSIMRSSSRYLVNKYPIPGLTHDSALVKMREAVMELNDMRLKNGGKFIYGDRLSLADIIASSATVFVGLPNGFSRVGGDLLKSWAEPELERDIQDFIQWRDDLYRTYRGPFMEKEGKPKATRGPSTFLRILLVVVMAVLYKKSDELQRFLNAE